MLLGKVSLVPVAKFRKIFLPSGHTADDAAEEERNLRPETETFKNPKDCFSPFI